MKTTIDQDLESLLLRAARQGRTVYRTYNAHGRGCVTTVASAAAPRVIPSAFRILNQWQPHRLIVSPDGRVQVEHLSAGVAVTHELGSDDCPSPLCEDVTPL